MSLIYWPQIAGPVAAQVSTAHDPYISSVFLLAHFDNNFNNSAPQGPASLTQFSAPNQCTSSSTQSKFGGFSCFSTSASHGCFTNSSGFTFGTGDYTIELWAYLSSVSTGQNLIDCRTSGTQPSPLIGVGGPGSGILQYFSNGSNRILSAGGAVSVNTWFAVALSRVSGTSRLFLNGTQVGSDFADSLNTTTNQLTVGGFNGAGGIASGYIDELRVTKGVGRYTTTYSVQTAAFPNQ
jgi:hypothetical protein